MEVRMINTNAFPPVNSGKTPEDTFVNEMKPAPESESQKIKTDVPEKVMMDYKDVQTFLYLIIGAHIKIDENSKIPGRALDMSA